MKQGMANFILLKKRHFKRTFTTIAQWIRLHLPFTCPGFKSQAHQLSFINLWLELCHVEKTKLSKKRPG